MAHPFRRALSANALSTFLGLGTQALTPPLFLWAIHVQPFSRWIFVAAVAGYTSLALNGLFYAIMNELVIAGHKGDRARSFRLYNCGNTAILALAVFSSALLGLSFILPDPSGLQRIALIGALTSVINLCCVMFDANFRTMDRYELGTYILTAMRTLDWLLGLGVILITRNVDVTLSTLLAFKIVTIGGVFLSLTRSSTALKLDLTVVRWTEMRSILRAARGQIVLSAAIASAAMGPQIVASLSFDSLRAVTFNTYRTYLRLTSALVTATSYASWPMLSQMYARGHIREMEAFLPRLFFVSMAGALVGGIGLIALAPPVFKLLFHDRIRVDFAIMALIFGSVFINCGITLLQSLYLATNLASKRVVLSFMLALITLGAMALTARSSGFVPMLATQIGGDICTFVAMAMGFHVTMTAVKRQIQPPSPQQLSG